MRKKYLELLHSKVIETLKLVAAKPEIQENLFDDSIDVPEEIAFTFEELLIYSKILMENGYIKENEYQELLRIDKYFEKIPIEDYTINALYNSNSWYELRNMSLRLLKIFKVEYSSPNLFWIDYAK